MSDKWYMTVGYPGGEFAAKLSVQTPATRPGSTLKPVDDGLGEVCREFSHRIWDQLGVDAPRAWLYEHFHPRPCPPDLAEWLDFGPMWEEVDRAGDVLAKVPGGWLIREAVQEITGPEPGGGNTWDWVTKSAVFIPVQGAQNITVLEADHVAK